MYKKQLNQFFRKHGVEDSEVPSAPAIAHFQIKFFQTPEGQEALQVIVDEIGYGESSEREEKVLAERAEIEAAETAEQLIRLMRRHMDMFNHKMFLARIKEFENEILPEVIAMLKRSLNEHFIEAATRVLSLCDRDIAEELVAYFDEVRMPYAQCMILVVLGFKGKESHIPWIMEKYGELRRQFPNESYSDGAIMALEELEYRFYQPEHGEKS